MQQIKEAGYNPSYRTENREIAIQKLISYKNTTIITNGKQLDENLYTTGCLESSDKEWPDKEQSIVLSIPNKGLVVLVGCSHPTISVIVDHAKEVTGVEKIYGIIGGQFGSGNSVTILPDLNFNLS